MLLLYDTYHSDTINAHHLLATPLIIPYRSRLMRVVPSTFFRNTSAPLDMSYLVPVYRSIGAVVVTFVTFYTYIYGMHVQLAYGVWGNMTVMRRQPTGGVTRVSYLVRWPTLTLPRPRIVNACCSRCRRRSICGVVHTPSGNDKR